MVSAPAPGDLVLVTGATGYIGGRLVPRLLDLGYRVRVTHTDPSQVKRAWWSDRVDTVPMDVGDPDQVLAACAGAAAVFYLMHGMTSANFAERERRAAENMAAAVTRHGVRRVVYLSGIVPPGPPEQLSPHLQSRWRVERILTGTPADVVTLRAAVVLGSGSTSFEIIRQISERLPVAAVPTWLHARVQPIAVVDVLEALVGALTTGVAGSYDVGGPTVLPYRELLAVYAARAGLSRPRVAVPFLSTDLIGALTAALTDVPGATVQALVESLRHDMVAADDRFLALLPPGYPLLEVGESIERALAPADTGVPPARRDPMSRMPQDPFWTGGGVPRPFAVRVLDALAAVLPERR